MADARKCDRCGKFYEQYNMISGKYNAILRYRCLSDGRTSGAATAPAELCQECYKDFEVFMNPKLLSASTTKEVQDMVDRIMSLALVHQSEEETKNGM